MFLCDSLPVNNFNKLMQKQSPTVHILSREIHSFLKKLLLRFLSPSVVQGNQISSIDLDNASHYLALDEVFVGDKASKYLSEECDLATREIRKFQETCRNFWITAAKYAISKLPLEDDFLKNLAWIYPHIHDYSKVSEVLLIASRLPQVIKEEQKAQLREEFMDYCTSELPLDLTSAQDTY